MSKYEPLREFLRKQSSDEVRMTFEQIERVIGQKLPSKAQHYRAWWSNAPSNNVMTKAWLEAGFRSEQVDVEGRKLVFRKVNEKPSRSTPEMDRRSVIPKRHPLFGYMKGTLTITPGVDLTEPADPEWGEVADGDKTWNDFK
jgi:hypothetical protein